LAIGQIVSGGLWLDGPQFNDCGGPESSTADGGTVILGAAGEHHRQPTNLNRNCFERGWPQAWRHLVQTVEKNCQLAMVDHRRRCLSATMVDARQAGIVPGKGFRHMGGEGGRVRVLRGTRNPNRHRNSRLVLHRQVMTSPQRFE
jgi:hypothetical protein